MYNLYPQTDLNQSNQDWLIRKVKELQQMISSGGLRVVSSTVEMTDHAVIYIYTGSEPGMTTNHWYHWDAASSTWVDGGPWGGQTIPLPLAIDSGGTGSTTQAGARTALGITPTNIGAEPTITTLPITKGGTGANTAAAARTELDITPTNIGAEPTITTLPITKGGTGAGTATAALSALGAVEGKSSSVAAGASVTITGSYLIIVFAAYSINENAIYFARGDGTIFRIGGNSDVFTITFSNGSFTILNSSSHTQRYGILAFHS